MKTIDQMTLAKLKAWKPEKLNLAAIREMAQRIAHASDPQKIILFGSYARGDATEQSDVDFLVIQETDLPRPRRSVPLYSALRNYPQAVDIVVYTPAEIEEYADLPASFVQRAQREGKVVYEKERDWRTET